MTEARDIEEIVTEREREAIRHKQMGMIEASTSRVLAILARLPKPEGIIARHKKFADRELYEALANCLELVEVCRDDPVEMNILNGLIKDLARNSNRRLYVESASDEYQRVCRYIFHGDENRSNVNRYAICLREAHKSGVNSESLTMELMSSGGINRFYLVRPDLRNEAITKCIRLDKQIIHDKRNGIVLHLKRLADNTYSVLQMTTVYGP